MPGSNPLFGLNTLGGALAIQTKSGLSSAGTTVQATYGSDVRRSIEAEHGGHRTNGLHWYVAGNLFSEDGWRDDSPSDVRQAFGKVGWQRPQHELAVGAGFSNNALNGNGLQEQALLDRDYASVYTKPDITRNRSTLLNVTTRHTVSGRLSLRGTPTTAISGPRRSTATSTKTRSIRRFTSRVPRNRPRWPRPATPVSRRVAPRRPTRRSRRGAASPTCSSRTSRRKNATGWSTPATPRSTTAARSRQLTRRDGSPAAAINSRRGAATIGAGSASCSPPSWAISIPIAASPAWAPSATEPQAARSTASRSTRAWIWMA